MSDKNPLATKVVHAGLPKKEQGKPFVNGPSFASTFHLQGDVTNAEYQYGRFGNPTWTALEDGLAQLEGGETVLFPSGMAAIAGILSGLLASGDSIVLPEDGYFATRAFAQTFLVPNGINVAFVKTLDLLKHDYSGVKLVLIETPSNPMLDVVDIALLAEAVHAKGGSLAIDNTTMTVHGQQPLVLGADISMCADTKSLNGHSDVVFGHVSSANSALMERVRLWRRLSGSIPGPMESWLVHRGLATLDVRMQRMTENAQAIAQMLSQHPAVPTVRYPGLKDDPSHITAKKQMQHFGFLVSFDLGSAARADAFLQNAEHIFEATSFGGVHTMAERRARWGTDEVPPGLIRLSVGCERAEDLIKNIEAALAQLT